MHVFCVAAIVAYSFLIGCVFKRVTGIDCPFCGMTRAHLKFFCGEFKEAVAFNRLFPLGIPFLAGLAHLRVLKRKKPLFVADLCFVCLAAAAFLINYVVGFWL
ncbi:MAG: DUF2752 domain-containing protein [Clostridia bacterium]|nr:DUF2752 domain-containing protein [Clostridia bacterium]